MTVSQLYEETIRPLPEAERLRLATLILSDIAPVPIAEYSDVWSEEDYRDFSRATWGHIEQRLQDEENAPAA